ncbi:MAG: tRNA threonylcarbamoyladenosine dehydratase, partial [Bacteroidales bacterium]
MFDWQERTELLIKSEALERLRRSHVFVAGLGGVGAMA